MVESYEHKFLKDIALIWLRQQGYLWVGTEIRIGWRVPKILAGQTAIDEFNLQQKRLGGVRKTWHNRFVIDCVGIKRWYRGDYPPPLWGCGIEAKTSREDYLSGFCFDRLNIHYVIAPRGVIPKSTLPKRVGLLEVSEVTIDQEEMLQGVRIAKRPRAIMLEFERLQSLIEDMCRHLSIKVARELIQQLPQKRRPHFKIERLPEIS